MHSTAKRKVNENVAVNGHAVAAQDHEVVAKAAIRAQRDLHVRGEKLHLKVHPLTTQTSNVPASGIIHFTPTMPYLYVSFGMFRRKSTGYQVYVVST